MRQFKLFLIFVFLFGSWSLINTSNPLIPANYITFTDEAGLFSISYPKEWKLAFSEIEGFVKDTEKYLESIDSKGTLKNANVFFFAGKPIETGYMPNVSIVVTPMGGSAWTLDNLIDVAIKGRMIDSDGYKVISRINTTVDGKESIIFESESQYPNSGSYRTIEMIMRTEQLVWIVTCIVNSKNINDLREDFYSILRSLRILKRQ